MDGLELMCMGEDGIDMFFPSSRSDDEPDVLGGCARLALPPHSQ